MVINLSQFFCEGYIPKPFRFNLDYNMAVVDLVQGRDSQVVYSDDTSYNKIGKYRIIVDIGMHLLSAYPTEFSEI